MTVGEALAGVSLRANLPLDLASSTATGLEYDSRRIGAGNLFFAFEGQHADGRRFAADAIGRGAIAVVSQSPRPADFSGHWIEVEHGRRALEVAARNFYGRAGKRNPVTGSTVTKRNKTSGYLRGA